jgi:hypothetical protein
MSRLTFNGLHGVISQKMKLFITKAVRTSNPILHASAYSIAVTGSKEKTKDNT